MPNIARCASALARVILLTVAFAVIATTADAVPAISPTGAARMEREKAEAQAKALKKRDLRTEMPRARNACARTETPLSAEIAALIDACDSPRLLKLSAEAAAG